MCSPTMLIVLGILLNIASSSSSDGILIGAFNVQIFGQKKSSNQEVMQQLVKIIRRYDVILIQEIRDSQNTTLLNLMNALNTQQSVTFTQETSERLGSTSSKEQYSFLIRSDSGVTILDRHQYRNKEVSFERPPFSVRLSSAKSAINEFVLTAIHTKPEAAVTEIDGLKQVHTELRNLWNTDNILIMGDLNAACSYASATALKKLDIRKDPKFLWLIPDKTDTTATASNCTYDRFVMTGVKFNDSLVVNSARVFLYDKEFGLSLEQTLAVSDHYPIELRLSAAPSFIVYSSNDAVGIGLLSAAVAILTIGAVIRRQWA